MKLQWLVGEVYVLLMYLYDFILLINIQTGVQSASMNFVNNMKKLLYLALYLNIAHKTSLHSENVRSQIDARDEDAIHRKTKSASNLFSKYVNDPTAVGSLAGCMTS